MNRFLKNLAGLLVGFILITTILPMAISNVVKADKSDYSVSWKSGGAEAIGSFYSEYHETDFHLFLNPEKLVCEFKTGGEVMNLKYKTCYYYDLMDPIEESEVVMNTTTLRCAFEPEGGGYVKNGKLIRGIYSFAIIRVDNKGNEKVIHEAIASVLNDTNGFKYDHEFYAIESDGSYTNTNDSDVFTNVKGFQIALEIEYGIVILPYTYEIKYGNQVLYTSPELIYFPSDVSKNYSAIAEYSSRVSSELPLESNGFLKEGSYRVVYHMFGLKDHSLSVEMVVVNTDCPPKTTLIFKDPEAYDSNTNTTYFREPSEINFDVTVDFNGSSYYAIYQDGERLGYPSILSIGTTNVTLNKRFASAIFNSDDTLNYGDYELVIENIFGNALARAPFTILKKNQPIPTPSPTPIPTAKPTTTPSKTPTVTPTAAPTSKPTGAPTSAPSVAPTKVPVATATPTAKPIVVPTKTPTAVPATKPTGAPTSAPSVAPTKVPVATATPTAKPTVVPTKTPTAVPTTKPTSAPEVKPSLVPDVTTAVTPSATPEVEPSKDNGVGGFIERLYTVAMDRDFDEAGKDYWVNEIKVNGQTGAEVALQFLFSDEFLSKDMTEDDFITILYRTFFDREPEAAGLAYWKGEMQSGKTKEWVIAGFINSPEWANICLTYGIKSGTDVQPTIAIVPNEQVIGFATRLYTTCLGRDFDPEGLDYWARELANLRQSGSEVAKGFFFSPEFVDSKFDDSEYLTRLYKTVMGREPEMDGFNYWMGELKSGNMTRESVFDGFAASPEWIGICADYGILR